jgi:hypothetical protein
MPRSGRPASCPASIRCPRIADGGSGAVPRITRQLRTKRRLLPTRRWWRRRPDLGQGGESNRSAQQALPGGAHGASPLDLQKTRSLTPLPPLLQPLDEARGTGPHRRGAPGADRRPAGPGPGTLARRHPGPLPRPTTNIDGHRPIGYPSYRDALYRWLEDCDIRDEHGQPVRLTPHQWRHTLGTRLKGRGVVSDASFPVWRGDGAVGL